MDFLPLVERNQPGNHLFCKHLLITCVAPAWSGPIRAYKNENNIFSWEESYSLSPLVFPLPDNIYFTLSILTNNSFSNYFKICLIKKKHLFVCFTFTAPVESLAFNSKFLAKTFLSTWGQHILTQKSTLKETTGFLNSWLSNTSLSRSVSQMTDPINIQSEELSLKKGFHSQRSLGNSGLSDVKRCLPCKTSQKL